MKCVDSYQITDKSRPRQSNIELLRIVAMLFIVAHHFSGHSGFNFSKDLITVNRLWVQFIGIGGKIGVNIFVLISGYFLVSSQSIRTNKVIKLWIQLFTYSILIFAFFTVLGINPFGIRELIEYSLPVTYSHWWFASTYFILYLLSPYINKLLNAFSRREYQHLLVLLTICWCVIPTFTDHLLESNSLLWFVYLYSLAGYIKLHIGKMNRKHLPAICFSLSALLVILTFLSAVLFDVMGIKAPYFAKNANYFFGMQKLPILAISVLMFIGFLKINVGYNRIINTVASATFGVYLIHDHGYVRYFLWQNVFLCASYSESKILIPYSLFVIALVFAASTMIELFRIHFLEKHYMRLVNALAGAIDRYKAKLFSLSIFDKF